MAILNFNNKDYNFDPNVNINLYENLDSGRKTITVNYTGNDNNIIENIIAFKDDIKAIEFPFDLILKNEEGIILNQIKVWEANYNYTLTDPVVYILQLREKI